jgi:hypothetical protein
VVCQNTAAGTYTLSADGTGTDSITLTPTTSSESCPTITFTESIAVGDNGKIVQAINSGNSQITTYEQWNRQ